MKQKAIFSFLFLLVMLSLPTSAAAQWYAGADLGMSFFSFRTEYSYPVGTPDSYVNRASGLEAGALLGYDFPLGKALNLGVEVRSATNAARWELDTDDAFSGTEKGGPAHLRFEIPWTIRTSAVLKVRILAALALTGELGMEWGSVRLNKTSDTSTRYSSEGWVPGFAAGAGFEWRLSPSLDLSARFAYSGFWERNVSSQFPDGEVWERIAVKSDRLAGRIGILFRIGSRRTAG